MKKVKVAKIAGSAKVLLTFDDGIEGIADLSKVIGKGVFARLTDPAEFAKAYVGDCGELAWPGGIDMCADDLYLRVTGKKPEDIFPSLKNVATHA